jgi:hypothetical protein
MHPDLKVKILVWSLGELKLRSVESFSMRLYRISIANPARKQEIVEKHDARQTYADRNSKLR